MRRSTGWGGAARGAIVFIVLLLGGAAQADRAKEMKARESFAAGRYDEALELFARLYAETLHPVYLRNIGRCHQKMRQPQMAIDAFQDYIAKSKKLPGDERREIEGYIKEMETLRDAQARTTQAVPLPAPVPAPPPVVAPPVPVALTAPTPRPAGGTPPSLVATAPPPSRSDSSPVYARWWFWTAIGVVAAGAVAAALLLPGGTLKPTCPAETLGRCK
jgi:tetratricopeptide (TPR) repeat protein